MNNRLNYLLEILGNGKKNICYGAGDYGQQLLGFLQAHGCHLDYFVVTENDKSNETIFGIPVVEVNELVNVEGYNWIIGVSKKYIEEIKVILRSRQIQASFVISDEDIENIIRDALSANKEFQNIVPNDKRCFVLGTGRTIESQDLSHLYNEDVFSCSFISLIEKYKLINSQYYILPALANDPVYENGERKIYIREKMNFFSKTIISEMIFADYNDRNYIHYFGGFEGKKIYYLYQRGNWNKERKKIFDLCEKTPFIQTGSIMMLKVAMYMGYKKIYLLGTEHDLVTHKYGHAYDLKKLKKMGFDKLLEIALSQNMNLERKSNREILTKSLNMYNQYYYLHNMARENGIQIYNTTAGGSLDEFERVKYESLFSL